MIKAELNYNPYLLETIIRFNGQEPRINSLVEKFQEGSLQKWVRRIPDIFYDEMNGFDFELEFSGTERDYLEVVDAFRRKGISEESVRVFHKNELDSRYEKTKLIDQLLIWLKDNKNRNFDFDEFKSKNADLFESSYVYIIFQGNHLDIPSMDDKDISVEHVNSTEELKDTDLNNTPILLYISKENLGNFQKNLKYFMERDDVEYSQLFFLIHPSLDAVKVERIIKDLGISEPNIVQGIFDDAVKKYIEVYPISDYIYSVVYLFRDITDKLSKNLQAESDKCAIANKEVHDQIDQYEETIKRLKEVHHSFVNRDNLEIPTEWNNIKNELINVISIWKKRKTKITNDADAKNVAIEFESDTRKYYEQFLQDIKNAAKVTRQDISVSYRTWYRSAKFDTSYPILNPVFDEPIFSDDIKIADELEKLVEEEYVQPKEDLLGKFFKHSPDTPKEPVLQRTYYYQSWREYVLEVIRPRVQDVINILFDKTKKYEDEIAESYIRHLSELIVEQTRLKDQEAAKLSDKEKILQNDIDWLVKVQDQLRIIERG